MVKFEKEVTIRNLCSGKFHISEFLTVKIDHTRNLKRNTTAHVNRKQITHFRLVLHFI